MALGIDPGWAKCGISAVARSEGRLISAGVKLVKTGRNKDKRFEHLRVSMDDERRHREYFDAFCESIEKVQPHVIGVEVYTIHESKDYEKTRNAAAAFLAFMGLGGKAARAPFSSPAELLEVMGNEDVFKQFLGHMEAMQLAVAGFKKARGRGAAAKTYGVYTSALAAARKYKIPIYGFMPVDLKKRACRKVSASKKEVEDALGNEVEGLKDNIDKVRAKTMHEHLYDASGHGVMALETYEHWMRDSGMDTAAAEG
jgi:Holliday junction resolvasome RuvABC endonuclease subunit